MNKTQDLTNITNDSNRLSSILNHYKYVVYSDNYIFSPSGKPLKEINDLVYINRQYYITQSYTEPIIIYDIKKNTTKELCNDEYIKSVSDGLYIITKCEERGSVKIWDYNTMKCIKTIKGYIHSEMERSRYGYKYKKDIDDTYLHIYKYNKNILKVYSIDGFKKIISVKRDTSLELYTILNKKYFLFINKGLAKNSISLEKYTIKGSLSEIIKKCRTSDRNSDKYYYKTIGINDSNLFILHKYDDYTSKYQIIDIESKNEIISISSNGKTPSVDSTSNFIIYISQTIVSALHNKIKYYLKIMELRNTKNIIDFENVCDYYLTKDNYIIALNTDNKLFKIDLINGRIIKEYSEIKTSLKHVKISDVSPDTKYIILNDCYNQNYELWDLHQSLLIKTFTKEGYYNKAPFFIEL